MSRKMTSTSPVPSKSKGGSSHSWEEWTQQLQAYVAWVNSQLKKRQGNQMVEDLRRDMQDGVALVHLVEIVSGETLPRVDYNPQTATAMRENVERVLQFMTSKRIRMHHTSAKDIVDGNLKAIMRLILSLAAHYKPSSVKQAPATPTSGSSTPVISGTPSARKSQRPQPSFTAMAASAAAAIHDARKEAASAGGSIRRYNKDHRLYGYHHFNPNPLAHPPRGDHIDRYRTSSKEVDGTIPNSRGKSPTGTSPVTTPTSSRVPGDPQARGSPKTIRLISHTSDSDQGSAGEETNSRHGSRRSSITFNEALLEEQDIMSTELESTKKLLSHLQELLLNGRSTEEDGSSEAEEDQVSFEGSTPKEQLVVLQARLDQQAGECNHLKSELSKVKQESRDLQGTKAGLQSRLTEQDNALLQMKAELLRMGFTTQNLEAESTELKRQLEEKERQLSEVMRQMNQKDQLLQQQQEQIDALTNQLQGLNSFKTKLQNELERKEGGSSLGLESHLYELTHRLDNVGIAEANLAAHLSAHDHKMVRLEEQLHSRDNNRLPPLNEKSDEMQIIRSTLRNLRSNMTSHDPNHNTLDSLEQSISSLVNHVHTSNSQYTSPRPESESNSSEGSIRRYNMNPMLRTNVDRRSTLAPQIMRNRSPFPPTNGTLGQPHTKVLYFTERTVTPFMTSIPKRLGEVTLRDFKSIFDKEGNFRYHFKALDPEFGTVKEEVVDDDDILPGWEGKIVGWVEEDNG